MGGAGQSPYRVCAVTRRRCVTESDLRLRPYVLQYRLGGGEGIQGCYGSIAVCACSRAIALLGLDDESVLFDIGAGLGR
jgi:hypothetical protein